MRVPLPVSAPFHLEATARVLQRRPGNLIDTWDGQCYRRTARVQGRAVLLEVTDRGSTDSPELSLSVLSGERVQAPEAEAAGITRTVLGLDVDTRVAEERARLQPRLREVSRALRGMRPPRYPELFETFANVIPFQQLSLDAGIAVTRNLVRRLGEVHTFAGREYRLFPRAEVIANTRAAQLKACGLSLAKARALRSVAQAIAAGALTAAQIEPLSSPDALERLMQLPGIGPWSAALVLLRGFGRLDVFPEADSGAHGSLMRLMRLRSDASLMRVIRGFGDYRGYLYFYGIASRLLAAGLIRPAPSDITPAAARVETVPHTRA